MNSTMRSLTAFVVVTVLLATSSTSLAQWPPHRVERLNRCSGPQEKIGCLRQIVERDWRPRRLQQSRAASGNQGQHDIPLPQVAHQVQNSPCRRHPALVRDRVRSFEHMERPGRRVIGVPILGQDNSGIDEVARD